MIPESLRLVVAGALVLTLSVPLGTSATDATWKTHQDQTCGIELKYPPSYSLEASGARDYCAPWINIGVRDARRLRALFSLEIRELERGDRTLASNVRTRAAKLDWPSDRAAERGRAGGPDSECV